MRVNFYLLLIAFCMSFLSQGNAQTISCNPPTALTSSALVPTTVVLNWVGNNGASGYNVRLRPVGSSSTAWQQITTQFTTTTIPNLLCSTTYEWQVQSICSNVGSINSLSAFTTSQNFTTALCTTPICIAPTSLVSSILNANSAILSWASVSGAQVYNIQYRPVSSIPTNWTSQISQGTTFTLTNLLCNTAYEWQVQSVCGTAAGNVSTFSASVTFTTAACVTVCQVPTGLTTTNITLNSAQASWTTVSGGIAYVIHYRPANAPNTPWQTLTTQTTSVTLGNLLCNTAYEWQVQTICSTSGGINSGSAFSPSQFFTTLVCPINTCLAATALVSSIVNLNTVILSWTASPGNIYYNVQYRPISTVPTNWTSMISQNTIFTLSNLLCNTTYQWRIQSFCSTASGSVGANSSIMTFTTAPCQSVCPTPTGLLSTSVVFNSAVVSWNAVSGAGAYIIHYRPAIPNAGWITITSQNISVTLGNLICNTSYEWQVASACSSAGTINSGGSFSPSQYFTTQSCPSTSCVSPTGLNATNVTTFRAQLNWNSTGAYRYEIRYRPANSLNWMSATSLTNSILVSGLLSSTVYEFQVRGNCSTSASTNVFSTWSPSAFFTSLMAMSKVYPNPAGPQFYIPVESATKSELKIELFDQYGVSALQMMQQINEGNNQIEINTNRLQDGLYFIQITGKDIFEKQKIFIRN